MMQILVLGIGLVDVAYKRLDLHDGSAPFDYLCTIPILQKREEGLWWRMSTSIPVVGNELEHCGPTVIKVFTFGTYIGVCGYIWYTWLTVCSM